MTGSRLWSKRGHRGFLVGCVGFCWSWGSIARNTVSAVETILVEPATYRELETSVYVTERLRSVGSALGIKSNGYPIALLTDGDGSESSFFCASFS